MCELLARLGENQRRGSKPRCHQITHGTRDEVAARLTALAGGNIHVSASDKWMPQGFEDVEEAKLDRAPRLISNERRQALKSWWLTVAPRANTPNWDIASTATIGGKTGLLLIEAKAHDNELRTAERGKLVPLPDEFNSRRNHAKIGWCIEDASVSLSEQTGQYWTLSRDSHYQMSNRFAWAWKLTQLDYPVVLVYLGFLNVEEMRDRGKPFVDDDSWTKKVEEHSRPLFPAQIWNQPWTVHGQTFAPLIRTLEMPLCRSPATY